MTDIWYLSKTRENKILLDLYVAAGPRVGWRLGGGDEGGGGCGGHKHSQGGHSVLSARERSGAGEVVLDRGEELLPPGTESAGSSAMSMSSASTISVVVSSSISCTIVVGSKIADK